MSILNVAPEMSDTIADFVDVLTKNKVLSKFTRHILFSAEFPW